LNAFIEKMIHKYNIKISYLNEKARSGTAGGLLVFKDRIREGDPKNIFILHSDVVCSFPLAEILEFHNKHGKFATVMGTSVSKEYAGNYGCIVADEENNIAHYAEKPHTFISNLINTGVYCFSKELINIVEQIGQQKKATEGISSLYESMDQFFTDSPTPYIRLEQDIIFPRVDTGQLKVFQYKSFWRQSKNAGSAVYCNSLYLNYFAQQNSNLIAKDTKCNLIGNNFIDPSAQIHPSAKIGPNVSIGANVKIGEGVRIKESIILDNADIKAHACILYCVIGWECVIGNWCRIEGVYNSSPFLYKSAKDKEKREGITIFGAGARAKPEIVVFNCIVMPNKDLDKSYRNAILL